MNARGGQAPALREKKRFFNACEGQAPALR